MNGAEFNKRIAIYKQQHTREVSPPDCEMCNDYAEYYDILAGEDYCGRCLEKSLAKDINDLIEHTNDYMGNLSWPQPT